MLKIRTLVLALGILMSPLASADTRVSIGINLPAYPQLVVVPGYPVYYAPRMQTNYFFYDGMYWVFQGDNWYASSWYNGPWWFVEPYAVPVYVLRVPVRYYRQPPAYFRGWRPDAPPRWSNHWGHDWEQHRSGWDKWDRRAAPAPAPLPAYQRQYSGDRYPRHVEQQRELQQQRYRYQPRDPIVKQHYQKRAVQSLPAQQNRQGAPEARASRQPDVQRPASRQQDGPGALRSQSPQRAGDKVQRAASPQDGKLKVRDDTQPGPDARMREEKQQDRGATREKKRDQEQGKDHDRNRGQGQRDWDRNR